MFHRCRLPVKLQLAGGAAARLKSCASLVVLSRSARLQRSAFSNASTIITASCDAGLHPDPDATSRHRSSRYGCRGRG